MCIHTLTSNRENWMRCIYVNIDLSHENKKKSCFFLSCTMRIFNCDSYIVYLYTHFGCDSLAIQNLQKPMGLDMTFLLPQNIINILQLYCALNTINSARAFNNNSNNIKQFAFAHSIYARQLKITAMFMENEKKKSCQILLLHMFKCHWFFCSVVCCTTSWATSLNRLVEGFLVSLFCSSPFSICTVPTILSTYAKRYSSLVS